MSQNRYNYNIPDNFYGYDFDHPGLTNTGESSNDISINIIIRISIIKILYYFNITFIKTYLIY